MHKKLIFSTLLFGILCVTNISFGMKDVIILTTKNCSIAFAESGQEFVLGKKLNAKYQNLVPIMHSNSSAELSLFSDNLQILTTDKLNFNFDLSNIKNEFLLKKTNEANIVIDLLQNTKNQKANSTKIYLYYYNDNDRHNPYTIFGIRYWQFPNQPSQITQNLPPNTQLAQPIAIDQNPTQPIIVDQWNIRIQKGKLWINPINGNASNINIRDNDNEYSDCSATLNVKNNKLTITKDSKTLIVIDISEFNSEAKQLIEKASKESPTPVYYSSSKNDTKKIYYLTEIKVISPTKRDDPEKPRLDSTPWWQKWQNEIIIGSLTLTGTLVILLFMYLRK